MSDQQKKEQLEYYDKQTEDYEKNGLFKRGLTRAYERKAKIINKELIPLNAKRIIEIGTGSGLMTYYLSGLFKGEYIAQDLSKEMIEVAKKRIPNTNVTYLVSDGTKLDFPDAYLDAVVGVDIIHHLENPVAAFKEWKRVVRPGGKMVFLETNVYNPINLRNIGVEHEVRSFLNTDKNLARWSSEAGWETVSVKPAPSYTPAGPRFLGPIFDVIDIVSTKIPLWKKLAALWLISNTKK